MNHSLFLAVASTTLLGCEGYQYQPDSKTQEILEDVVETVIQETTGLPVEGALPGDSAHEKNNTAPRPVGMFGKSK